MFTAIAVSSFSFASCGSDDDDEDSTPILVANGDLFVFPVGDSDQSFLFNISPSPPNPETETESKEKTNNYFNTYDIGDKDKYIYIQSALLYSYGDGKRRIRVHNLCLPLSNNHLKQTIDIIKQKIYLMLKYNRNII